MDDRLVIRHGCRRPGETPRRTRRGAFEGQSIIEFAMVGLILLTLSFGVIEFGRAFAVSMAVTHASRDGARIAMNPEATDAEITAAVQNAAGSYDDLDISIARSTVVGEMASVTVSYDFEAVTPLVANLWGGGSLTISETTISRVGWE